jgi:hypothetical protein
MADEVASATHDVGQVISEVETTVASIGRTKINAVIRQ